MPTRKAEAEWKGNLIEGAERLKLGSGALTARIRLSRIRGRPIGHQSGRVDRAQLTREASRWCQTAWGTRCAREFSFKTLAPPPG